MMFYDPNQPPPPSQQWLPSQGGTTPLYALMQPSGSGGVSMSLPPPSTGLPYAQGLTYSQDTSAVPPPQAPPPLPVSPAMPGMLGMPGASLSHLPAGAALPPGMGAGMVGKGGWWGNNGRMPLSGASAPALPSWYVPTAAGATGYASVVPPGLTPLSQLWSSLRYGG